MAAESISHGSSQIPERNLWGCNAITALVVLLVLGSGGVLAATGMNQFPPFGYGIGGGSLLLAIAIGAVITCKSKTKPASVSAEEKPPLGTAQDTKVDSNTKVAAPASSVEAFIAAFKDYRRGHPVYLAITHKGEKTGYLKFEKIENNQLIGTANRIGRVSVPLESIRTIEIRLFLGNKTIPRGKAPLLDKLGIQITDKFMTVPSDRFTTAVVYNEHGWDILVQKDKVTLATFSVQPTNSNHEVIITE